MKPVKSVLTLGIMSGTSLDGVDYALCETGEDRVRLRDLWSVAFPGSLRKRLHAAAAGTATSWEVAQLHHDLGRFYARGALRVAGGRSRLRPRWVGLHGQTIYHHPDPTSPATLQIGEPAYLAQALEATVVSNFRAADLAAGGQGAPLATAFHVRVFGARGRHVCVNNLGGISNVTSIDWRAGAEPRVTAFDTGPANVLLDLAVRAQSAGRRALDRDGRGAARGRVCEPLLDDWLRHPFFRKPPPKSTGRELFGEAFLGTARAAGRQRGRGLSPDDLLATLTELTARSIAMNYRLHLRGSPDLVILSGGGARNPVLRASIGRALLRAGVEATVMPCEEAGWPCSSIEPAAFAWLAWLRVRGRAGNLPGTTGARHPVLCGQMTGPSPGTAG